MLLKKVLQILNFCPSNGYENSDLGQYKICQVQVSLGNLSECQIVYYDLVTKSNKLFELSNQTRSKVDIAFSELEKISFKLFFINRYEDVSCIILTLYIENIMNSEFELVIKRNDPFGAWYKVIFENEAFHILQS